MSLNCFTKIVFTRVSVLGRVEHVFGGVLPACNGVAGVKETDNYTMLSKLFGCVSGGRRGPVIFTADQQDLDSLCITLLTCIFTREASHTKLPPLSMQVNEK